MTNAPIILTLDCDMYSNDPSTPQRALCYFLDPTLRPDLAYVQFPQTFHGLNAADIYANEIKPLFITNPMGMDGLNGPNYVGTGCFFRRRAFFGPPSSFEQPEIPELFPDHVVNKPIKAHEILRRAHYVASSNYESGSNWGSKVSFSLHFKLVNVEYNCTSNFFLVAIGSNLPRDISSIHGIFELIPMKKSFALKAI